MEKINKKEKNSEDYFIEILYNFLKGLKIGLLLLSPVILSIFQEKIAKTIDKALDYKISGEEMLDLIKESDKLSDEEKEYLANEELMNDIEEVINNSDNGILIKFHLDGMKIVPMSERDKKKMPDVNGYYEEVLKPKRINVRDYDSRINIMNKDIVSHEFIHCLESCSYNYIREAFTSLVNSEYYTSDYSYREEQKRLKVLMETIGPQPIWEAAFAKDSSKLDTILDLYLTTNDSNKLKELLNTKITNDIDRSEINSQIDELLAELYYNIYGKDIKSDKVICALKNNLFLVEPLNRKYFNIDNDKDKLKYILTLNEFERLGYLEEGVVAYHDIWVKEKEYEKNKDNKYSDYSCIEKGYSTEYPHEKIDDNTIVFYKSAKGIELTYDEAIKKGYLNPVYCLRKEMPIYDLETIEKMVKEGYTLAFSKDNKKELTASFFYDYDDEKIRVCVEEFIPTIKDKIKTNVYPDRSKALVYDN